VLSVKNNNIRANNINNSQHNQNNNTSRFYPKKRIKTFQTSQKNNKQRPQDSIEKLTQKMNKLFIKTCQK